MMCNNYIENCGPQSLSMDKLTEQKDERAEKAARLVKSKHTYYRCKDYANFSVIHYN